MKRLLCIVALISTAFAARPELDEKWESFKEAYNKAYADEVEEGNRREIWELNYDKIQQHNAEFQQGLHTYSLGENSYADLSSEEFASTVLMTSVQDQILPMPPIGVEPDDETLPKSVDWRQKDVVTPVKDQKQCGSCWAFSATGSMEGAHALKTGKLVSLSEQNLVDCAGAEGNMGCFGGFPDWGMQYVIDNNGIDTEDSYPYKAENEKCHFNKSDIGATISKYTMVKVDSDQELLKIVATVGPVSIGMDAGHESFQMYKAGIYSPTDCSKTRLDHGVLVVGYGEEKGKKYWIVKNSWGTTWGMDGYFMLDRDEHNMCGISTRASYPTI